MRKIFYILLISLVAFSCDSDSNNSELSGGDLSGQGGSLARFAIAGDYLYVVDEFGLNVFNIATASDPVLVNQVPIGFAIETLFGLGDNLYIGSRDGMFIYSIANPEFPEQLSAVEHFTACDPVVSDGEYAYVTLWTDVGCGNFVNLLETYNVQDPVNPILVNQRNLSAPKGLGLYGDYLIVCDDEIKIFDVSVPEDATLVHSIDQNAFDVIIYNDVLIAIGTNGLYQYQLDPGNIENTTFLSEIDI